MTDEEFIKKYEELLDKGYCDCNEMNCIDNDVPRKILNIVKGTKLEAKQLLEENRKLRKKLENSFSYEEYDYQVNRNIELRKEKQELIEYLKEQISILDNILENEKDEDNVYYCLMRRTTFKEVLNKIEKSDK